ncbi:MAG TPA: radical SAM protein [Chitinispirillaceae bacterium]|nr:radical SAM protein [Chitinispirillaceae bacterium]
MKIKLVAPKMSLRPMDSEFKRLMAPSIALLVLAALTPEEYDVEIIDENVAPIDNYDRVDLVGITCNVDTFEGARIHSLQYQKNGSPVIFGGIFPSSSPQTAGQYATSVCIGDAEPVWHQILKDAQQGNLKKTYRCENEYPAELIPQPKWSAVDCAKYLYTNIVITSRGCPYKCDFCYNSSPYMQRPYRRRKLDDVIDEIKKLNTKQVLFIDDNFIGDKLWVSDFLRAVKPLDLTWHAAVSADIGKDLRLLDCMKETGCRSLYIGFESINANSIAGVGKSQNKVSEYGKIIDEVHRRGIMINASLVFGFDNDYPDVFETTLDWLIKNRIETMTSHILTPYPGTKLYERLQKEGRIIDNNLNHYNTSNVVFQPKNMTPDELLSGYLTMYNKFYSVKNILRRIPKSNDVWIPYLLFNLGYRKFGSIASKIGTFGYMHKIGRLASRLSYGIG